MAEVFYLFFWNPHIPQQYMIHTWLVCGNELSETLGEWEEELLQVPGKKNTKAYSFGTSTGFCWFRKRVRNHLGCRKPFVNSGIDYQAVPVRVISLQQKPCQTWPPCSNNNNNNNNNNLEITFSRPPSFKGWNSYQPKDTPEPKQFAHHFCWVTSTPWGWSEVRYQSQSLDRACT